MHELYVINDLHMGRGKNPQTGRFYTLEAFFYDDDFWRFCDYLCRDAAARQITFKLVLNGDTFDLLRIEPDPGTDPPTTPAAERFQRPVQTPEDAAQTVAHILQGHPAFVAGLAHVLAAGHDVVILPGNHDIEIQWANVQDTVRQALSERIREDFGDITAQAAIEHLEFYPWFYYEAGRIWIEHGCQYDPENSFHCLLRQGLVEQPNLLPEVEMDLPLGNFFQRYLYNAFGHITFIVPSSRANIRYLKWLILNQPRVLFRVISSHAPFAFQMAQRLAKRATQSRRHLQQLHEKELSQLADESGLGLRLLSVDEVKETQGDVVQAVRAMAWQAIKFAGWSTFVTILLAGLWSAGFLFINQLQSGVGPKALWFLFLNVLLASLTLGMGGYMLLREPLAVPPRPLRRAAQRIANIVDVPLICFGHSHDEELWPLAVPSADKGWYFNSGTWIAVFTHDVLLPRERVQYTFLHVKENSAELLHYSPGRDKPLPVILLDESDG